MKALIAGATGATGRHLVAHLLQNQCAVTLIVRSKSRLPETIQQDPLATIIEASILKLSDAEMAELVKDCDAVASCLGHNLHLKGIYGKPRKLVTDATCRLCKAIQANQPTKPIKFVLMNTAGNRNRDLNEPITVGERVVVGLLRGLLPPHPDNEQAADYLRTQIGQNHKMIEWVAVRPDTLINEEQVSTYEVHPSPTRSAIFNPGKTSRINVGHFMGELIMNEELWREWKGQMPVIYNKIP